MPQPRRPTSSNRSHDRDDPSTLPHPPARTSPPWPLAPRRARPAPSCCTAGCSTAGAVAWSASILAVGQDPGGTTGLVVFGRRLGPVPGRPALPAPHALADPGARRGTLRPGRAPRSRRSRSAWPSASTFVDAVGVSDLSQPAWLALDLFWPLSMLGMFLIGIRIAVAGRWTGLTRYWPVVAESWAVVTIPAMGIFGETAASTSARCTCSSATPSSACWSAASAADAPRAPACCVIRTRTHGCGFV